MNCPSCDTPMRERPVQGAEIAIDLCPGCRGVWLDGGELGVMIGGEAPAGERARQHRALCCPRCDDPLVARVVAGAEVAMDVCRLCRGVWLDQGEIEALQAASERQRAAGSPPHGLAGRLLGLLR